MSEVRTDSVGIEALQHRAEVAEREVAALREQVEETNAANDAAWLELYKACEAASGVWSLDRFSIPIELRDQVERRRKAEAELAVLREENQRERVRRFGILQSTTADHTTGCSIWGDDGQGNAAGFSGLLPCNCGALRNYERKRAESAEARVTALEAALRIQRMRDEHVWNCKIGKDCAECARLNDLAVESRCDALGDVANPVSWKPAALTGKEDAPNG